MTEGPLQHDDHVWLVLNDQIWAISEIRRPGPNTMKITLWRVVLGSLEIEYQTITLSNPDWTAYNALGVQLLKEAMANS